MESSFEQALETRVADILERCTACGACVEVCPMPAPAGIDASDPSALASGVLAVCTGSGHCIPACQYGVNPRFMLAMARLAKEKRAGSADRRRIGFTRFTGMTTGVRVLSRLQLPPDLDRRVRQFHRKLDTEGCGGLLRLRLARARSLRHYAGGLSCRTA